MIPSRYLPQVQSFLLALVMTLIMSFFITFINLGFIEKFTNIWMHAWGVAFVIAFPTLLLIVPYVRKLAMKIASKQDERSIYHK